MRRLGANTGCERAVRTRGANAGDDRSVKIKALEAAKIVKIKWLVLGSIEADFCKKYSLESS